VKRSFAIAAALMLLCAMPALAGDTLTFVGKVTHLHLDGSPPDFQVEGKTGTSSVRHTFFVDGGFNGVYGSMHGTKKKLSDLHLGTQVQVTYRKATLFGRLDAVRIVIVDGFAIPMTQPTGSM